MNKFNIFVDKNLPSILKLPLVALVILSFSGSLYVYFTTEGFITKGSVIILFIVILLYFSGMYIEYKRGKNGGKSS